MKKREGGDIQTAGTEFPDIDLEQDPTLTRTTANFHETPKEKYYLQISSDTQPQAIIISLSSFPESSNKDKVYKLQVVAEVQDNGTTTDKTFYSSNIFYKEDGKIIEQDISTYSPIVPLILEVKAEEKYLEATKPEGEGITLKELLLEEEGEQATIILVLAENAPENEKYGDLEKNKYFEKEGKLFVGIKSFEKKDKKYKLVYKTNDDVVYKSAKPFSSNGEKFIVQNDTSNEKETGMSNTTLFLIIGGSVVGVLVIGGLIWYMTKGSGEEVEEE